MGSTKVEFEFAKSERIPNLRGCTLLACGDHGTTFALVWGSTPKSSNLAASRWARSFVRFADIGA